MLAVEARAPRRGGGVRLEGAVYGPWAALAGGFGCSAGVGRRRRWGRDAAEES